MLIINVPGKVLDGCLLCRSALIIEVRIFTKRTFRSAFYHNQQCCWASNDRSEFVGTGARIKYPFSVRDAYISSKNIVFRVSVHISHFFDTKYFTVFYNSETKVTYPHNHSITLRYFNSRPWARNFHAFLCITLPIIFFRWNGEQTLGS